MLKQDKNFYQKQPNVFTGNKRVMPRVEKTGRWHKKIGFGIETPKEASEGNYIDKKCPFTSDVVIRGFLLTGKIVSMKMDKTIIVRRDYLHFIPKYSRYEKRHKNIPAHISPAFPKAKVGDTVTIGECRPLSKTVRFNVVKINETKKKATFSKF
eukprot:GHVP01015571.1.p1 GENE.GHVP01015571.1~~GHVP01015571.1.p1  ORF type:complete len:154 (-),score=25.01 GHVP01015571.1:39-500(-)